MPSKETGSTRSTSAPGAELFAPLSEMNRDWTARLSSEIEFGLKLSKNLNDAHSIPDALAAYREWLNDEMGARAEDARLLLSHGQKLVEVSSQVLSYGWSNLGTTT